MKAISNVFGVVGVLLFILSGCMMDSENIVTPICIFIVSLICLAVFGYSQKYIEEQEIKKRIREKYGF